MSSIKNDKEFLNDGLTNEEIRKVIKNIREYIEKGGNVSHEDRVKKLELDNAIFKERYPILFEMASRETFDYNSFNYFLNMRENVINDNITHENASKIIGKEWFDKYVDVNKLKEKKR